MIRTARDKPFCRHHTLFVAVVLLLAALARSLAVWEVDAAALVVLVVLAAAALHQRHHYHQHHRVLATAVILSPVVLVSVALALALELASGEDEIIWAVYL